MPLIAVEDDVPEPRLLFNILPTSRLTCSLILITSGLLMLLAYNKCISPKHQIICSPKLWSLYNEFEGFDNVSGVQSGNLIVPNYVHFIRMGWWMEEVIFIDALCILAAYKIQKPDKIFIHTDVEQFGGKYWEKLISIPGFEDILVIEKIEVPNEIFGQKFTDEYHHYFHASDVVRIRILLQYGGIFLDNDSFIVRSLDPYRRYEMALPWDENDYLGTQILIAHKDARFLQLWLESYKNHYKPKNWYFNAGEWPTMSILWARPELVHRVKLLFGVHDVRNELFTGIWPDWRNQYTIHILERHLQFLEEYHDMPINFPEDINDKNVREYAFTFKEMAEEIYEFDSSSTPVVKEIKCKDC
ncbi:uncharacterized protein LOC142329262 isoform X3 [Lycorma delicatula]|uniref:uncharacterized protein LOC142329262 isoform X3 n=1 Tax=Lycorma delicatula TaxID=130591 RepID=UPI003F51173A